MRATSAKAPASSPPIDEPVMAEGTEIDARALLASIDARPAPIATTASERPPPKVPEPAPAPAPPPPRIERPSTPALREGEQALRTGSGHVVLRRRRAAGNAA